MSRYRRYIMIGSILLAIIFAILIVFLLYVSNNPVHNRVFDSMEDLKKLETFVTDIAEDSFSAYDKCVESFCKKVSYQGNDYLVFAYVLEDTTAANKIFEETTGKNINKNWNYSLSSNYLFRTRYIAFYENYLYIVKGGSYSNTVDFINWLNSDFSVDLDQLR